MRTRLQSFVHILHSDQLLFHSISIIHMKFRAFGLLWLPLLSLLPSSHSRRHCSMKDFDANMLPKSSTDQGTDNYFLTCYDKLLVRVE